MTFTEVLVIVSGLAIGYWLVAVFVPNARSSRDADAEAAAERDEVPGGGWFRSPDRPAPWHETLGVDPDASHEAIVAAYKRMIGQYHPHKVATMAPEIRELAERRSAAINAAYDQAMRQLRA
jgi:DnaJ like chaperone protein